MKIKIDSINEIHKFVELVNKIEGDVILSRGHVAVDAKSILGVMYINPYDPVEVESVLTEDTDILWLESLCNTYKVDK